MMTTLRIATLLCILSACTDEERRFPIGGSNEGDRCSVVSDCRAGLACEENVCITFANAFTPSLRGQACVDDSTCAPGGLVCGRQGVCAPTAGKTDGAACALTVECAAGLVCSGTGSCVAPADPPAPGTLDLDAACEALEDCRRPYVCGLDGQCARIAFFSGAECNRSDEENGAFRFYFEVPSETASEVDEFYRLPFPNDVRTRDGKLFVTGHARPGEVLGVDVTQAYIDAINADTRGFAPNGPIFFRSSEPVDIGTLCLDPGSEVLNTDELVCRGGGPANLVLANIDPTSPGFNTRVPVALDWGQQSGQYICQNWFGVAPLVGDPLEPGTTYAVLLTNTATDQRGQTPIQDTDLIALLADNAPQDERLGSAYAAFAPLRSWLPQSGFLSRSVAMATVFTTTTVDSIASELRNAVHARAQPQFNVDAVTCNAPNKQSPCAAPQFDFQRNCPASDSILYSELQGTLQAPIFQSGTRPYALPEMGGGLNRDSQGILQATGEEALCFGMSVPKGTPPTNGWPVVLYAHGTNGSYRSFVGDGTAARFARIGVAVLSFDNVMHGPRQGVPPEAWNPSPGELFFNIPNPIAARDNVLQGAADLFHLVRLLTEQSEVPRIDGAAVPIDGSNVIFFGHSQGTVIAPAFLAVEDRIRAAILSGAGAELTESLLGKTQPVDISFALSTFFADRGMTRVHPMMGLLTQYFPAADALVYADQFVLAPRNNRTRYPLLMTYGLQDSFTPVLAQEALVRATGIPFVGTIQKGGRSIENVDAPQSSNVSGTAAGAVQMLPDGYDGHFVAFSHPEAEPTITHFVQTALSGQAEITRGNTP